jgi:hypothetical protein
VQLGTRWPVGSVTPDALPQVVRDAVHAVENEREALDTDTTTWGWTLTWLEGSPLVELDDGTVIRYNAGQDSATTTQSTQPGVDPFPDDE